ncbi:hypothetical protein TanjilG_32458 [Lupinus angustifolius]|uniref:Fe2OG dioxygenase domain-containing protein n=1 Tax=Lupinus angustifolius TaxID=3871 RepID=A0A1J7HHP6_LUPAN|nr:PREDICTED: protein DOWNY MILDEW RESISTANCE 6-like [Lupinus angustifolius]OIW12342.1 hypothetical protein TanjilG_32458 [Lupinus angustifolius]
MDTLDNMFVSNWSNVHFSVPPSYVQPIENRPGKVISSSSKAIPVIDFGAHDHDDIAKQILKASEEFGFFQVINHGVSKDLMDEAVNIFKEFHAMPPKEKVNECSRDPNGRCKFYTSSENYKKDAVQNWKDTLTHSCPPSEQVIEYWPQKPPKYREIVRKYTQELGTLGFKILELLCEGLGLNQEYFCGELTENPALIVHHYPPCPNPSLTLGVVKHRDPSIITILLQDEKVHGLQVFKDGEWIVVEPIPNAFVVNIGLLLQIISNGRLIGAEHRVVTNSSTSRTSVAYFIYPSCESIIEPSNNMVNENDAPRYKSMTFGEFRRNFFNKGANIEAELLY